MTVVSLKTEHGSRAETAVCRIGLSDGSLFSFKSVYLPLEYQSISCCVPGQELSDNDEAALRFAASCYRTERVALRLVARAEQCGFGLAQKLEIRGHTAPCVRAVLAHLSALEVISDERFALRWLQSRFGSASSPRSLLLALSRRGISRQTARQALDSILDLETESALLRRYVAKRRLKAKGQDRLLKSALKYEGFSLEALQAFFEEGEA